MPWVKFDYATPTKEEERAITGEADFYADHNLDDSIVQVLRFLGYDVENARELGAERQPDEFHFKHAFRRKRILLTQDKDYLDHERFPLSQTRGVFIFNIDTANTSEIARALEVVDTILGETAPAWKEKKLVLHSDYTVTVIRRVFDDGMSFVEQTRYRFDMNGRDIWVWGG